MLRSLDTFKMSTVGLIFILCIMFGMSFHLIPVASLKLPSNFYLELGELRTTTLISIKGGKKIISEVDLRETSFIAKYCLSNKTMELFEPPALLECNIL